MKRPDRLRLWRAMLLTALISLIVAPAAAGTRFARRGDVTISYQAEGKGRLIVLLPSMGRGGADFRAVARLLAAQGFRVLRPDPRGIGSSTGPAASLTLHDFAEDVASTIRREHLGPAIVVGHAFGNFVARTLAADHPELVRGVVVAAGAAKSVPADLRIAVAGMGDLTVSPNERLRLLRIAMFAPGHDAAIWLTGWYPRAQAMQREAIEATPQTQWWSAGSAPILELQPADDPFKPASLRGELAAELGTSRVTMVVIPNASHALFPEQPAAVAAAIGQWARRLP